MKTILPAILACFIVLQCSAQDSLLTATPVAEKKANHELFINTTFFVKQLVSLSNANLEISPYILGYKVFAGKKKQHGLRLSVGGDFGSKKQLPDSSFVRIDKTTSIDYRVGYEFRYPISKVFTFFTGVDVRNSFFSSNSKVNSSFDIVTTGEKGFSIGGGPVVGIQVNLHKRISLFTETAFYYAYSKTKTKTSSINFPDLNTDRIVGEEHTGSFLLPTSLFFVFRF